MPSWPRGPSRLPDTPLWLKRGKRRDAGPMSSCTSGRCSKRKETQTPRSWSDGRGLTCNSGTGRKRLRDSVRLTTLQPASWRAWNLLGWAHGNLGKYEQAVEEYTDAIQLKSDVSWCWEERGRSAPAWGSGTRPQWITPRRSPYAPDAVYLLAPARVGATSRRPVRRPAPGRRNIAQALRRHAGLADGGPHRRGLCTAARLRSRGCTARGPGQAGP